MVHAQREFVADASHELRTPLTSILANLELLQDRLEAEQPDGEETEMVELRAALLPADAPPGRRPPDARPRGRGPLRRAAPGAISPRSRRPRSPRSAPSPAEHSLAPRDRRRRRGRGQRGRAPPADREPARQRASATRPTGSTVNRHASSAATALRVLEVADDGPGPPRRHGGAGLLALRPRWRPRRPRGGLGHRASASRSSARSPSRTAARSRRVRGPNGGARFTVTLPASDAPADAPSKLSAKV